MIKNYITIALRNLWRNKTFSSINIFGLAIGIACSLLIFLFVKDELKYDRFNDGVDNTYRVVKDFINDDGTALPDATTPPALAPAMQREIPGIAAVTRVFPNWGGNFLISYADKKITEEKVYRVDSSFFDVFSFPFIQGDKKKVFEQLNSIVVTESAAKRYFGKDNPMGKVLHFDNLGDMAVTGVIKDVPAASHFHFDFLVSVRKLAGNLDADWNFYNFYTYVKLKEHSDAQSLTKKIQDLYKRNVAKGPNIFYTQPLKDIHLTSNLKWELEPNADKLYVYVFAIIGFFIILIAAINYINLSTSKASARAKEIGVRKVIGAARTSLINQFLVESIITGLAAFLLALVFAQLLLPVVNTITLKQLSFLNNYPVLMIAFFSALLLGLIAGFFPAIYLSSFKPIAVLKGLKFSDRGVINWRKALVVVQFTISITLIIGAVIISQQMKFIQSAKLGLNPGQVLYIKTAGLKTAGDRETFKNNIAAMTGVKAISVADGVVGGQNWASSLRAKGSQNSQFVNFLSVGNDFLDVMGMDIKEGRGFSSKFPADTMNNGILGGPLDQTIGSIILNETAVKDLGITEPAVGKQILWSNDLDTMYHLNIVGIVKDFHFTSLRDDIKPFAFVNQPRRLFYFTVKLSADNIKESLAQIETRWKSFAPDRPIEYSFLDETFAKQYQAEDRFQVLFITLVILGILIACLGLLGLAIFSAQQRVKEIGIRKVLGASVTNVVGLLSKDFLKLVMIALVIAIPIGWYSMNKWLEDFAYRISIHWWVFGLAGCIAVLIAFFTVSFQALKAAIANPVKSLRTE